MKRAVITIVVVLMTLATLLCAQPAIGQPAPAAAAERQDQFADLCWVLLLCVFSFFARSGRKGRYRYHFLSIAFLLLVLAAFHSHPLWSFGARSSLRAPEAGAPALATLPTTTGKFTAEAQKINHGVTKARR